MPTPESASTARVGAPVAQIAYRTRTSGKWLPLAPGAYDALLAGWRNAHAARYPGGYDYPDYPSEDTMRAALALRPWGTTWCAIRPTDDQPVLFRLTTAWP